MGYMIYIDDKPTNVVNSLEEAKQLVGPQMVNRSSLRIESLVAPAPSQIWIYDYKVPQWVEQK